MSVTLKLEGDLSSFHLINVGLYPASWLALTRQDDVEVIFSDDIIETTGRVEAPIVYLPDQIRDDPAHRARTPAHVRELNTMQMLNGSDQSVTLSLNLGPILQDDPPVAQDAAPEAQMQLKGPLLLSCFIMRDGQRISDPSWKSPFCARVKTEMNLSQHLR